MKTALALADGALLCVRDGAGVQIRVACGALWVTQENDSLDRLVRAGESFRLDRAGLATIAARGSTRVELIACELARALYVRERYKARPAPVLQSLHQSRMMAS